MKNFQERIKKNERRNWAKYQDNLVKNLLSVEGLLVNVGGKALNQLVHGHHRKGNVRGDCSLRNVDTFWVLKRRRHLLRGDPLIGKIHKVDELQQQNRSHGRISHVKLIQQGEHKGLEPGEVLRVLEIVHISVRVGEEAIDNQEKLFQVFRGELELEDLVDTLKGLEKIEKHLLIEPGDLGHKQERRISKGTEARERSGVLLTLLAPRPTFSQTTQASCQYSMISSSFSSPRDFFGNSRTSLRLSMEATTTSWPQLSANSSKNSRRRSHDALNPSRTMRVAKYS